MKENFTQVPNVILDDEKLSWDEKGVMTTFFRNKRDWRAYKDEFIRRSTDGKTVINRIFKSLEEKGLIDKKTEGGTRLENGRFTPTETYFQLSAYSINLLEGISDNPVKSTASRKPNSGDQLQVTENPPSATNKTNDNNTNSNKTKENKTNSVSVSDKTTTTEIDAIKTDSDTGTDFIFIEGIQASAEKNVSPSSEEKFLEVNSNQFDDSSKKREDFQVEEITPSNTLIEGGSASSVQSIPVSSPRVEGLQAKEKQPSSKYFFNYEEKPSLERITAYAAQKGYSCETAYEVFNVLADNDYCDSIGNQIQSIENYINTILSQKKKELKPDAMKELRAISDAYADLYASELTDNMYGATTHRVNMWEFVKYYLSTHDNDTESVKRIFKNFSARPVGEKISGFKLISLTKHSLKERASKANATA